VDIDVDPAALGGWSEVDDACTEQITIAVGDTVYALRCENDAGHEPPCGGTVWWTTSPEPPE
jgi:hypothetical protein